MAYPQFDGFELQTDNYVTEEVEYRTIPTRSLDSAKITRREGVKLLADDFAARKILIRGYIVGTSSTDLKTKIDNLHANVTRKTDGSLLMESGRSATATVSMVSITDPHYAQDMVPFEVEFLLADPFFYGSQQTLEWNVPNGTTSLSRVVTISGSIYALPQVKYTAPAGAGQTSIEQIDVQYSGDATTVTWSGTGATSTLAYGDTVTFDYHSHKILEEGSEVDVEGVFARWDPGNVSMTVTFSGAAPADGTLAFSYQPRYL